MSVTLVHKKLIVIISSSLSEIVLGKIYTVLLDAGVISEKKKKKDWLKEVDVNRDSSGKITSVEIKVSHIKKDEIKALLLALAGVVDVDEEDIFPDSIGWDCTAAALTDLTTKGWTVDSNFNTESNVTYINDYAIIAPSIPDTFNGWRITSPMGAATRYPAQLTSSFKLKTSSNVGTQTVEFVDSNITNQSLRCSYGIITQGPDMAFAPYINYMGVDGPTYQVLEMPAGMVATDFHTYKLAVDETNLATYTVDDTVVATFQLATVEGYADQCALFLYTCTGTMTYTLDFWQFSD